MEPSEQTGTCEVLTRLWTLRCRSQSNVWPLPQVAASPQLCPAGGPRLAVHLPSGPSHAIAITKHQCFFLEFMENQITFRQPCFLFSRMTHRLV